MTTCRTDVEIDRHARGLRAGKRSSICIFVDDQSQPFRRASAGETES